jgi:hypothetical protein
MHGMLRTYSGENAKKLATLLEERKDEIDKVIRGVPSLITWGLMRTSDGCSSFTLCQDKTGCEESARIAREWIQKNVSDITAPGPTITEGPVTLRVVA